MQFLVASPRNLRPTQEFGYRFGSWGSPGRFSQDRAYVPLLHSDLARFFAGVRRGKRRARSPERDLFLSGFQSGQRQFWRRFCLVKRQDDKPPGSRVTTARASLGLALVLCPNPRPNPLPHLRSHSKFETELYLAGDGSERCRPEA